MNYESQEVIEIIEHKKSKLIPLDKISIELVRNLKAKFANKIEVEFSSETENGWRLKSKGWVGFIGLSPKLAILFSPKVKIQNLFQMLEYAYEFELEFQDKFELAHCDSIDIFYDRLACLLASRILERAKKGFYQTYISIAENHSCVRGRIDIKSAIKNPWDLKLRCKYQKYTGDIPDNRILTWTLYVITQSGVCKRSLPKILQAYQTVRGVANIHPCSSKDCIDRYYNRLNEDYRPLHALCRFFLESNSASFRQGEYGMLSFLIDMATLFESFVASWLNANLPVDYRLQIQDKFYIAPNTNPSRIDLVIHSLKDDKVHCVIDTKYKRKFEPQDFYQIFTYAASKNCSEAALVYPELPKNSPEKLFTIQNIRVRILVFSLKDDLETAGKRFKASLLGI